MDEFIGINEQLGKKIPLNLVFKDEQGIDIELSKLVDKPTIFMFVYYECPGICSPLMSEVAAEIEQVNLEAGKDFQLVAISFDDTEGPALAYAKKVNYMDIFKKPLPDNAWKFLTGDSASIAQITNAVGFGFKREGEDFVHPGGLIIVSKEGIITRYLLGTDFMPFDLKMAVIEASEGKVTPTIAKMLKFCYSYDRESKRYALNITRIAGIVTLLAVGVFVLVFIRKPKKQTTEKGSQ
ncbi:MAG: SCO family protein [Ignavibacteriaceae bacterium]|nr:SCO family protein [Ignavibacteriaceae bacterium]